MKAILKKLAPLVSFALIGIFILAACDSAEPRVPVVHTYNTGAAFSTNFNHDDPRRQIRCIVVLEVIDESAIEELETLDFIVRNSILSVLGELTMDELTVDRDLVLIRERIVNRVNEDLALHTDLVVGAYFTEFAVQ